MSRRNNRGELFITVNGTTDPLQASFRAGRSALNEFGAKATSTVSEIEREFQRLSAGSPATAARDLERAYSATFNKIRENMRAVLDAPTGQAAVQIIDVGAAQQAVQVAELRAGALRQVAEASRIVAGREGENAQAARVYAAAAEAASLGADRYTQELREQLAVLERVEGELRSTTGATQQQEQTGQRVVVSTGAQRAAMQQLGFQLNDVAVGFAAGTPPMIIFAQQSGQVVQALQMMNDGTSKFLGFLGGPWGIVMTSALIFLTPFIAKLLEGNDTLDDAVDKLAKDAEATDRNRQAKELFNRTLEGTIDRQRQLNDEMARGLRSQQQQERDNLSGSRDSAKQQAAGIASLERELADARRRLQSAQNAIDKARSPEAALGAAAIGSRIETEIVGIQRRLDDARKALGETQTGIINAEIKIAQREVTASLDASLAAQEAFTNAEGRLIEQRQRNLITDAQFRQRLAAEQRKLEAAQEAEQKRKAAERSNGTQSGTVTTFLSPVDGRTSGRFGDNRGTHRHGGVDYAVPVGTPVRAAASGAVDFANERGAYGNLIIINHGAGTSSRYAHLSRLAVESGARVEAGDVIGYSGGAVGAPGSGRSTGPHLHYEVRRGSRAVDPTKGQFVTDSGGAEDAAAKAEERALREQQKRDDDARAYQELKNRAVMEQFELLRRQTVDIVEAARLDEQMVDLERGRRDAIAQAGVDEGRWTQAQADAVVLINARNAESEKQIIRQRQATALLDQQLNAERDKLLAANSLLDLQGSLATTNRERQRIAQQILDNETKLAEQQAVRLMGSEDPLERQRGEDLKRQIDRETPLRQRQLDRQFAGPVDQYRNELVESVGDWDEAMLGVKARGLAAIEDGLTDIISGTASVSEAFSRMSTAIIADIARIVARKAILSLIGFKDGGQVDGIDAFADGGRISGPGTGTSDSILALVDGRKPILVSNGESIVTADATRRYWPIIDAMNKGTLPAFADGGIVDMASVRYPTLPSASSIRSASPAGVPVTFDLRGAVITEQLLAQMNALAVSASVNVVREAAPALLEAAVNDTLELMARPRL